VAVAPDGTVYVLDAQVHAFSPEGQALSVWGQAAPEPGAGRLPAGAVDLTNPTSLLVDGEGNLYVSDVQGRLRRFTPSEQVLAELGDIRLGRLNGLALDGSGRLFGANQDRVQLVDPRGQGVSNWGGPGRAPGEFAQPADVALDAAGNVYVADTNNDRVQVLSPEGAYLRSLGRRGNGPGELDGPTSVAVGPDGSVYVADTGNGRVQRLAADGSPLATWGAGHATPGQTTAAALANDGSLYLLDSTRLRVFHVDAAGALLDDWPLLDDQGGRPASPRAVMVDGRGEAYLVDPSGHLWTVPPHARSAPPQAIPNGGAFRDGAQLGFDARGNLLMVGQTGVVQTFAPNGTPGASWQVPDAGLKAPQLQVAVDRQGQRYVLARTPERWDLRQFAPDGRLLARWSAGTGGFDTLPAATGLVVAADGTVLIVAQDQVVQLAPGLQVAQAFRLDGVPSTGSGLGRVTLGPSRDLLLLGGGLPAARAVWP
jgi:sugar lactone lactonase YvrE